MKKLLSSSFRAAAFTPPMLTRSPVVACVLDTDSDQAQHHIVIGCPVSRFNLHADAFLAKSEGSPCCEDVNAAVGARRCYLRRVAFDAHNLGHEVCKRMACEFAVDQRDDLLGGNVLNVGLRLLGHGSVVIHTLGG